jgi:general secretion pathway protein F
MTAFRYEAFNAEGQTVGGRIDAESLRKAQRLLKKRGLSPIEIHEAETITRNRRGKRKSAVRDRILMLKELAILIEAGVQLADAVDSLAKSRVEEDLRIALENVGRELRQGQRLVSAFKTHLSFLPIYVHQLIEAGDVTGQLKGALKDAVLQMEYDSKVSKEITQALFYPMFLILMAVTSVLFIFIVVVPRFADMVKGHGDALPFLSRAVLGTGVYVHDNLLMLGAITAGIIAAIIFAARQPALRLLVFDRSLNLPVIGAWLTETETARWTAMMATLLGNRIPLLQALELARGAITAPSLHTRLMQVERMVRSGTPMSTAIDEFVNFPSSVINLIRVGERAGNLSDMLRTAADMTEESTRSRMAQVLAILEPGTVLFIGGFVGLIVVAIFTAITSVNQMPL